MGLFSSKKKIYVSSVAYPLGEDDGPNKRDFLKYTVLNTVMQGQHSVGEAITQGYLRGQGMSLRNSFKYALDKYSNGVPTSQAKFLDQPDQEELVGILEGLHPGYDINVLTLVVGTADHEWFAEKYLAEEHGYDRTSGLFDRPPAGVDANASIAYDLEPNGLIRILLMNSSNGATKVIDFRPTDYVAMSDMVHCAYEGVQVFDSGVTTTVRPKNPGEIDSITTVVVETVRAGEVQTKTTRTTVDVDETGPNATVKVSVVTEVRTRPQYFLYRIGKGTYPVIDAWVQEAGFAAPYYPAIPLRVNNVDMCAENKQDTELYKTSKKFLDRVGIDIDEMAESLNDNESIDDIDFAFVTFGVQLNVKSQEGKRYLFEFFQYLRGITSPGTTKQTHSNWKLAYAAGNQSTPPAINAVQVYSEKNRADNHDIKLQWDYIDTTLKTGLVFPNAKIGDVDIVMSGTREEFSFRNLDLTLDSSKLYARRQVDANTYEELEISGLYYENFIYKGKSVSISAYDAFHDPDEEGFIVPLNQQIIRQMSLRDVTDLAYHCCHMVLNCYKVVKKKWYQSGFFKIIMVIVAIVITVVSWGSAAPAAGSLIGIVFGGMIAAGGIMLILAATLYVLAMMILMQILTKVSTQLFGEKWGAVFAAVAAFVIGNWGNLANIATTGFTATQIIQAGTALLNAYGGYVQGELKDVYKDITKLQDEFEKKFNELEDMMEKMLGTNTDLIDIQGMTDATYQMYFEPMDQFLARTLLTGNDIAELTNGQVTEFSALGLRLPTIG